MGGRDRTLISVPFPPAGAAVICSKERRAEALRECDAGKGTREVAATLTVPIAGVFSEGQQSIRRAVASVLPGLPHQLCQFHYLREAARPIYEADRHATSEGFQSPVPFSARFSRSRSGAAQRVDGAVRTAEFRWLGDRSSRDRSRADAGS